MLVCMLAYQLFSFLVYVYLYAKLLHMPATDSILSISLYVYNLVQSFILACYMPAYMPNIHCAKSYVFAYASLYICYSAMVKYASWDVKFSIYLYAKCFISYAVCYMPAVICQGSYAGFCMLNAMC
jgi:hypothetical protein